MASSDKEVIEQKLLSYLVENKSLANSLVFCQEQGLDHAALENVLKSLRSSLFVELEKTQEDVVKLTKEGEGYADAGSPEVQVFSAVPAEGMPLKDLQAKVGKVCKIGFGKCMKNRWLKKDKAGMVTRLTEEVQDEVQAQLKAVREGKPLDANQVKDLKKRKMVGLSKRDSYSVSQGPKFAGQRKKQATDITAAMMQSGEWKEADFKAYNLNAQAPPLRSGFLHPVQKVRTEFRNILLEMGFSEMPTNNFVESSFWNFDALFQPQQHPARDSHDTFFMAKPEKTLEIPAEYLERVKTMHEKGGHGSIGYDYDWKVEEARKNILRTHTTAVSSRMLYQLAQSKDGFKPMRMFSIDRVFRNESLDATHLAEFHQVEGWVADRNLTLGDLIGTIKTFFSKIGIDDVKFKPAFNPYTEPSMEIFGYSKELKKWMELGNSGIFRPEMLAPMGLPEDVRVIAWGLSLERPTMIKYGIKNIRDLFGPKVKLPIIAANPIARFY